MQGISNHLYVPEDQLLEFPGQIDLSAYVNFVALAQAVADNQAMGDGVVISQGDFLKLMGIDNRVEVILWFTVQQLKANHPHLAERLDSEVERLTHSDEMGEIYKFMFITKKKHGEIFPFSDPDPDITYS